MGDEAREPHAVDRRLLPPVTAAISYAVRFAVPDGASSFWS